MVPHRLIEINAVQDLGIVAGEQLLGDDEDLGKLVGLVERFAHCLLLVVGEVPAGQLERVVVER